MGNSIVLGQLYKMLSCREVLWPQVKSEILQSLNTHFNIFLYHFIFFILYEFLKDKD